MEEAAGSQKFGVQERGTGGAANEVVGEQGQFYVKQWAFADATDDGGHAAARVDVAARLRAVATVQDKDRVAQCRGERRELRLDFKIAQSLANFPYAGRFLQTDRDALEVALKDWDTIAVGAEAQTRVEKALAIPFPKKFLRLGLYFFFFAAKIGRAHV